MDYNKAKKLSGFYKTPKQIKHFKEYDHDLYELSQLFKKKDLINKNRVMAKEEEMKIIKEIVQEKNKTELEIKIEEKINKNKLLYSKKEEIEKLYYKNLNEIIKLKKKKEIEIFNIKYNFKKPLESFIIKTSRSSDNSFKDLKIYQNLEKKYGNEIIEFYQKPLEEKNIKTSIINYAIIRYFNDNNLILNKNEIKINDEEIKKYNEEIEKYDEEINKYKKQILNIDEKIEKNNDNILEKKNNIIDNIITEEIKKEPLKLVEKNINKIEKMEKNEIKKLEKLEKLEEKIEEKIEDNKKPLHKFIYKKTPTDKVISADNKILKALFKKGKEEEFNKLYEEVIKDPKANPAIAKHAAVRYLNQRGKANKKQLENLKKARNAITRGIDEKERKIIKKEDEEIKFSKNTLNIEKYADKRYKKLIDQIEKNAKKLDIELSKKDLDKIHDRLLNKKREDHEEF